MILSQIFSAYKDNRDTKDNSLRSVCLVLLREIINNKIEIEGLIAAAQTTEFDSRGDSHSHGGAYSSGRSAAQGKWSSDLADIASKLDGEDHSLQMWDKYYKRKLKNTPVQPLNGKLQMDTNAKRLKGYDDIDVK